MIRNYGIGAQIIKDLKIKNMTLLRSHLKSYRFRWLWYKDNKTGNYLMKRKYLIVIADYYKEISKGLLHSALKEIPKLSLIKIIKVPGVFEIPVTISKNIKKFDAFIALGCVIKGQTPHFDFISSATTNAIMNISIESKNLLEMG